MQAASDLRMRMDMERFRVLSTALSSESEPQGRDRGMQKPSSGSIHYSRNSALSNGACLNRFSFQAAATPTTGGDGGGGGGGDMASSRACLVRLSFRWSLSSMRQSVSGSEYAAYLKGVATLGEMLRLLLRPLQPHATPPPPRHYYGHQSLLSCS